eukprot:scaffold731_cov261-Pinguiococcus_pyrenoidosus.AAC.20
MERGAAQSVHVLGFPEHDGVVGLGQHLQMQGPLGLGASLMLLVQQQQGKCVVFSQQPGHRRNGSPRQGSHMEQRRIGNRHQRVHSGDRLERHDASITILLVKQSQMWMHPHLPKGGVKASAEADATEENLTFKVSYAHFAYESSSSLNV